MLRVAFLPFLPVAFATQCVDIQPDTRYEGTRIGDPRFCEHVNGCTDDECCDFCRHTATCIAWGEVNEEQGKCWLFSSVNREIYATNWRSGNYTRPLSPTTTTTTTTTAGPSTTSTAGPTTTSRAGPTTTTRAGQTTTSAARSSTTTRAGQTTTSRAGSSTTSAAGSSTTTRAGQTTTSAAVSSTTTRAGQTTTSRAGSSTTSAAGHSTTSRAARTTSTASPIECPCTGDDSDCSALRDLYSALSPKEPALSSWCKEGKEDPCSWATDSNLDVYIGCTPALQSSSTSWGRQLAKANRRIAKLRVRNSGLEGIIPDSIGDLSELTELDLSHNALSGAIPNSLSQLTKLQELSLEQNHLQSFPASLCDFLARVGDTCSLGGNAFADPPKCASECGVHGDHTATPPLMIIAVAVILIVLLCLGALLFCRFRSGKGGGKARTHPFLDDVPGGDFAITADDEDTEMAAR